MTRYKKKRQTIHGSILFYALARQARFIIAEAFHRLSTYLLQ